MSEQGWNLDGGGGKSEYTKFSVGVTRIRVLSQAPYMRWVHWMNQYGRSVTCPGNGCAIDTMRKTQKDAGLPQTYNMSKVFSMNVYNHDTGRLEIMEQGITFMEDLKAVMQDLAEENKQLTDVILKVRRRGTGKDDTVYRIDVDDVTPLNSDEKRAKDEMKVFAEYLKPATTSQINQLLDAICTSPDEYKEEWKRIMEAPEEPTGNAEVAAPQEDEQIEVEG